MPDVSSIGPKRPCRRPPAYLAWGCFRYFCWKPQRRGEAARLLLEAAHAREPSLFERAAFALGNTTSARSTRQRAADHVGQLRLPIRLGQQQHAGVEAALVNAPQGENEWQMMIAPSLFPGERRNQQPCQQMSNERWRLTYNDADEIRALFSDLIGKKVDDSFLLIPPFYATGGLDISVGRNVFVNQNCTFFDLGGLDIADDVMIGPNVSIITSGHPIEPSQRRAGVTLKPIAIERNVWVAAGATIIGGVTVGENSVVAAGSVVTKDVPPNTLVGGNPARVIRSIAE